MQIIPYIPDPLISALSWSLLHSLWQFLAVAVLWRLTLIFTRKAPALVKQNLSILALLCLPVVFLITFFRQLPVYKQTQQIAYLEFENLGRHSFEAPGNWYVLYKESNPVTQFLEAYTPVIFWMYFTGLVIFSLYFVLSYYKVWVLRNRGLTPVSPAWEAIVLKVSKTINPGRAIRVFMSPNVTVPVVAGFIKPVILLPLAVSASLSLQEVEDILLHEFYHIKCKDHYVQLLQHFLKILFFYHPAVWWISHSLHNQRESKVDEWVVKQTRNPLKYAQTLLSLEQRRISLPQSVLAATQSKNSLFKRIQNIMHMKTQKFSPGQKIASTLVILLAIVSLAWLSPAAFIASDLKTEPAMDHPETAPASDSGFYLEETLMDSQTPTSIVLANGESIHWQELSQEVQDEVSRALREAQVAIREAMKEMNEEFNSQQMQQEFQQAAKEIMTALSEARQELSSEEFQQEMQKAAREIRQAMQEVNQAFQDEDLRAEMREVYREMQGVMQELNAVDWAAIGKDLNIILEEASKSLDAIAPAINDFLKNLDLENMFAEPEKQEE